MNMSISKKIKKSVEYRALINPTTSDIAGVVVGNTSGASIPISEFYYNKIKENPGKYRYYCGNISVKPAYVAAQLKAAKDKKHKENDAALALARTSHEFTVTLQGSECVFDTKKQTQDDLNSAAISASAGTPWPWTTNNRVTLALTLQDLTIITAMFQQVVSPDIDTWTSYSEQIDNAATIEAVQSIRLDY